VTDDPVAEARAAPLHKAFAALGFAPPRGRWNRAGDTAMPCPICGGRDRFAVNPKKGVWNCRGAAGGRDAIGMAAHLLGLDVRTRDGLLAAAHAVLRRSPDRETERPRQMQAAPARDDDNEYRARERAKADGKWRRGRPLANTAAGQYLALRCGIGAADLPKLHIRALERETLWDATGDAPSAAHEGPAMVGAFVDVRGEVIGCHLTWIDLHHPSKFRPPLPVTKKMRGSKKGGLIPLAGGRNAPRWVAGEGIENVLVVGAAEGFRADTFYCAAGDLGNLAGPAEREGGMAHPTLRGPNGRPAHVPSPVPRADQAPPHAATEAMWIDAHARESLLVADGDSEMLATAAMMARARSRLSVEGRKVTVVWPPAGMDFCDVLAGAGVGE
jgi:hypothetical protein